MSTILPDVLEQLLASAGFIRDGKRVPGLLDAESARASVTTDLRYRRLISEDSGLGVGSTIDLVYESPNEGSDIPGTPCIYFKFLHQPLPEVITELRKRVWNQGRSPTLWIVTTQSVRIYDGYARPQNGDDDRVHLLGELKRIGEGFRGLQAFHKREFDSGAFWASRYGERIKRSQRVDQAMLADLEQTEALLIGKKTSNLRPLARSVAHGLLGRSIFVSYLVDRNIIESGFFRDKYQCANFSDLLNDVPATLSFFNWLSETFNGDLFPLEANELASIEPSHLRLIQDFLGGADLSNYPHVQKRLWPYSFDVIPVDLISSIYEMFAYSHDHQAAEGHSVHYTRLPVVELLLSLAMRDVSHTARVLDPACGSGIFLVEAFRRLAWMRSKEYDHELRRDELHDLLRSQIYGIDVDAGAIQVAAFSLYLTLLELDPDPQPPAALRFPPLRRSDTARSLGPNLYVQDFCNTEHAFNRTEPFVSKGFDIIVGNPPWTGLTPRRAPRDPDSPTSGKQWSLDYCRKHHIYDKNPDQAFLWRARDFAGPQSRIAFIIGSRLFAQQASKGDTRWLNQFLETNTVETVVNLSDLVAAGVLFGGRSSTLLPASIMLFRAAIPATSHEVMYITPMWYQGVKVRGEIIVTTADIHTLSQSLLRKYPYLWKSAFRGTPRDYRLLRTLGELPSLQQVLSDLQLIKDGLARGFTFGRGPHKDASQFRDIPFLPSGIDARYRIDVAALKPFGDRKIAARSNTTVFQLPALVFYRRLLDGRQCVALVEPDRDRRRLVIDQMYNAVSLGDSFAWLAYRLNAILNSRMGLYMAFMFSSNFGWNWGTFEQTDYLQIRLPDSIGNPNANRDWHEVLRLEQWLRTHWRRDVNPRKHTEIEQVQARLDEAVYQLYDLSEQEIILVEDTLRYNVELLQQRHGKNEHSQQGRGRQGNRRDTSSPAGLGPPSTDDLRTYALRVGRQLNDILRYGNLRLVPTVVTVKDSLLLRACRFTQQAWTDEVVVKTVQLDRADDVLNEMSERLRLELADHLFVQRDIRAYESDGFWIVKPAEKRLWSEAAALNDADTVLSEHMEALVHG